MSTFNLLRLSAEKRLDGSSFGVVIVTGWSSYLTSGRAVEFTLLDVDDKLGWTLTPETPAETGEVRLRIPAASVGHRLEVTVRLFQNSPVDSCTETYTHWDVVEKSSCLAIEVLPSLDGLSCLYEGLSLIETHDRKSRVPTVSISKKAIRDGLPQLMVSWQQNPATSIKATLIIDLDNSRYRLHLDRWRITVAEKEEASAAAGIAEQVFVVLKEDVRQQRFEVPPNILESGVRYKVTVEGLIDDKVGSNGCFRLVCRNAGILQTPKVNDSSSGSFRIEIQRDSYSQAAVTIHNSLHSYMSRRTISITRLLRSPWITVETQRSWQWMDPSGLSPQKFVFPLRLSPGGVYEVTVSDQATETYKRIAHFRAELTPNDIHLLHEMALRYNSWYGNDNHALCRWIYRNRPPQYFDDIRSRYGGLMKVYDKNSGGDPGCPINHRIKGLFFTATVNSGSTSGEPIYKSPFGTSRLIVPVEELLRKAPNLYFADFCCKGRQHHYVTIVMTKSGSEADRLCADHLLSLSVHDRTMNPFLFYDAASQQYRVTARWYFLVELFFTEDLDIRSYQVVENVPTFGRGTSLPEGVPKNKACNLCNLRTDNCGAYYNEF